MHSGGETGLGFATLRLRRATQREPVFFRRDAPAVLAKRCRHRYLHISRLLVVSTTIRVSEETRDRLASLAGASGRPMTRILDEAVDALERKIFFASLNRRYEELRNDSGEWAAIEQERRAEEGAVGDTSG